MHCISARTAWSALILAHFAVRSIALPTEGKVPSSDIAKNPIAHEMTAATSPAHPKERSLAKRTCSTYTEDKQYTSRGEQRRVSQDVQCPNGDCHLTIETTVSEGRWISDGASDDLFEVISTSTDMEFPETTKHSIAYSFDYHQDGCASWSPALLCTRGTVSDCGDDDLKDGDDVEACTPQLYEVTAEDGETFGTILGEYTFVINQPGSG